jgi:hypothetical protein
LKKIFLLIIVIVFLSATGSESSENKPDLQNDVGNSPSRSAMPGGRIPVIPSFIRNISYDVTKTDSEIALINRIEILFQELSGNLSDPILSLLKESQLSWVDYYEKETYGLNPANGFVVLNIDGGRKRINAYRENMKAILEGRILFINSLMSNEREFPDKTEYDDINRRIRFFQTRVEYFSEERNRPRVWAGEKAWKQFINVNDQFLECIFVDDVERIERYKMYTLEERLKILKLQIAALELLRIEVEESY